ncbi:ATP-binding protein [Thaumasiovibrio subtropicus]|uniref:ATP-binding protein n=1 Tax=Thaumasiovibrio subtropicus TaxID=1891207 RepID=UPI000B354E4C|nr:ATP-binding protein [Thaumasiovibrio subtropicus]
MTIFQRLWLSFFFSVGIVLLVLYLAIQWSFDQGLINHINEREKASLDRLTDNLEILYEWDDSFQLLATYPFLWGEVVRLSERDQDFTESTQQYLTALHRSMEGAPTRETRDSKPPRGESVRPRDEGRRPPPREDGRRPPPRRDNAEATGQRGQRGPSRSPKPPGDLRVSLLDAERISIVGPYDTHFLTTALWHDASIVGYLAWPPKRELETSYDLAFADSQQRAFSLIAGLAIVMVSVAAFFFSRHFSRPLKTLSSFTTDLSNGNYEERETPSGRDEIAVLGQNINRLALTLKQAETSRKEWLASIAHELRTPLSIIKGEFEAILDGVRPANEETLGSIEEEIAHLQKLIEDLYQLTNAEIGAFRYHMSELDVAALLEDMHEINVARFRKAGLTLRYQTDVNNAWIRADETRLQQLLENLLNNSLKYTDSPGETLIVLRESIKGVTITVEDTSPDVPHDALTKLFEHLYRVESSRNRKTGGSGLGLAITQKIVEAHQGKIHAEHSPMGGLKVVVWLPK